MFLPVIPVSDAPNSLSDLQLANTAMSPAEHSRKHRQRTVPQEGCANVLTGDFSAAVKAAQSNFFQIGAVDKHAEVA
jgi:hypothetical protein